MPLGLRLWLLWVLSRVSPPKVAPPSFLLLWRQLLIHHGLCEIVMKLMQQGCISDPCVDSPSFWSQCLLGAVGRRSIKGLGLLSCKPDSIINFVAAILIAWATTVCKIVQWFPLACSVPVEVSTEVSVQITKGPLLRHEVLRTVHSFTHSFPTRQIPRESGQSAPPIGTAN
jgi:hypothetical protein